MFPESIFLVGYQHWHCSNGLDVRQQQTVGKNWETRKQNISHVTPDYQHELQIFSKVDINIQNPITLRQFKYFNAKAENLRRLSIPQWTEAGMTAEAASLARAHGAMQTTPRPIH